MAALGGPNIAVALKKVVKKKRGKRVGIVPSSSSSPGKAGSVDLPDP
jgi:hypothetical protein